MPECSLFPKSYSLHLFPQLLFVALLNSIPTFESLFFIILVAIAKWSTLIAVYVAPTCIRWFHWNDCKLNRDMIKHVKAFIENKEGNSRFKLAFL